MKKTIKKTGVVAELNGKYWGCQYEDGRSRTDDFGPIENAEIGNPRYCKKPEAFVYTEHFDRPRLKKARLRRITVTTTFEVGNRARVVKSGRHASLRS